MNKTLKELKDSKEMLEFQIQQLIVEFEEQFEVKVKSINIYKATWRNTFGKELERTSGLSVEIDID